MSKPGEEHEEVISFREMLENLSGDVYLYFSGEITSAQLMGTQGMSLRLLAASTPEEKRELPWFHRPGGYRIDPPRDT